jgi:tetratricopeptide (TPR) repeat protein
MSEEQPPSSEVANVAQVVIAESKETLPESQPALNAVAPMPKSTSQPAGDAPLVFISYRVNPDEKVAGAVQRLIKTAIDPAPDVFVSGLGGLRPSAIGFKPQIQAAARRAKAFIGIITKASKEREWLFYEAGAAWGREQLYAPLLVDTEPKDLPSTIADYQATRAFEKEEMIRLVQEIANAVGATVVSHFGTRYAKFTRSLEEEYLSKEDQDEVSDSETPDKAEQALRMLVTGKYEEADKLYKEAESSTTDPEQLELIRIRRIVADDRLGARATVAQLETLSATARQLPDYHYFLGIHDERPNVAAKHLQKALELSTSEYWADFVVVHLAKALLKANRRDEAIARLSPALSHPNRAVRSLACQTLTSALDDGEPLARMMLFCIGIHATESNERSQMFEAVLTLAAAQDWHPVSIYLARRYSQVSPSGTSWNRFGMALSHANMYSTAFRAYEQAAAEGVSVAKANMASLLGYHNVPAAGLKILQAHVGAFDAARPYVPFEIRGGLEKMVHDEQIEADKFEAAGERMFLALLEIACDQPVGSSASIQSGTEFEIEEQQYRWRSEAKGCTALERLGGDTQGETQLTRLWPFTSVWTSAWKKSSGDVYFLRSNGDLGRVSIDLTDKDWRPVWKPLTRVPSTGISASTQDVANSASNGTNNCAID